MQIEARTGWPRKRDNKIMAEERYLQAVEGGSASLTLHDQQSIASRYLEYEQLTARALEVFGSEIEAARWLSTQSQDFGGRTPLQDFIKDGPDQALGVLGRLEHGVY
jgi:uncharacterized protein (DUF2384 family)